MRLLSVTAIGALATLAPAAFGEGVVFSATGSDAEVTAGLDQFRAALGALNPNLPGSVGSGRREINWDGVPDSASAPNAFPPDFFNANTAGRARGVVFGTPGSGFQNSADNDNPTATPINFANLNPQYAGLFRAFSPQRMFTALGSTITIVNFFVPGSNTPATVSGFGVVFSDVDNAFDTQLIFLAADGSELGRAFSPVNTALNGGATFVGMHFDQGEQVARVAIMSGNIPLSAANDEGPFCGGDCFSDAVAMDDFVYGEPIALTVCPGDVDGSGAVDLYDLAELLASFGLCIPIQGFNPGADFSGNGCVELADLALLLANFGNACQ